jgi:two-component system, LuxR family, sensor kinase FixL
MSIVTILWPMVAAAALTLGTIQLLIWFQHREKWERVVFFLMSLATAGMALTELGMMTAATGAEFGFALRWNHVPVLLNFFAIIGFLLLHLRAGRVWLALLAIGIRTISLVINFLLHPNINFREITGVRQVDFLGDQVSLAIGRPNPLMAFAQSALLVLLAFAIDVTVTVWRRGEKRRALLVGGSLVFFIVAGTIQAMLSHWGIVDVPAIGSVYFLGMIVVTTFDLSLGERRAAQLSGELAESEQRMTLAAEAANMGIWIRYLSNSEIWASDQWRTLFGFAPEDSLDFEKVMGRLHPDDRETVRQSLDEAVARGGRYDAEFRLLLPDGGIRWISAHSRVESDEKGRPLLVRGASRDCTARKEAELETQRLRQEITHVGRVSMMGQLASALAHEINQPLGAILRNAEAAEIFMRHESPDLDEIRAILADIRRDDQRAGLVIERMRSLLKRHDLDTRPLAASELIAEVASLLRGDAAARRVNLEVAVFGNLPTVSGDRVHLQQVLLNLIINAMDALDGGLEISRCVTVMAHATDARMIEIAVSDSGPGIPEHKLARVFDPFFTTKSAGMGMGLPISQTIVQSHGGQLWAENNPDGGATFRFTLPTLGNEVTP